jgi:hypothetical protein
MAVCGKRLSGRMRFLTVPDNGRRISREATANDRSVTVDGRGSLSWELCSFEEDRSESERLIASESKRARELEAPWQG